MSGDLEAYTRENWLAQQSNLKMVRIPNSLNLTHFIWRTYLLLHFPLSIWDGAVWKMQSGHFETSIQLRQSKLQAFFCSV